MDISVETDELALLCEALQKLEAEESGKGDEADEKLKNVRKLFQRLHTLQTAK
jgi:hypothetical protein